MKTIKQVLVNKGRDIYSISPSASVIEAVKMMAQKRVGALLVLEDGTLKGIISEQDYTRKVILTDLEPDKLAVRDIMTRQVVITSPEQPIQEVMAIMTDRRIRHLPVIHEGELVGVISIGDLVKEVIPEQQFMIEQLIHYIQG